MHKKALWLSALTIIFSSSLAYISHISADEYELPDINQVAAANSKTFRHSGIEREEYEDYQKIKLVGPGNYTEQYQKSWEWAQKANEGYPTKFEDYTTSRLKQKIRTYTHGEQGIRNSRLSNSSGWRMRRYTPTTIGSPIVDKINANYTRPNVRPQKRHVGRGAMVIGRHIGPQSERVKEPTWMPYFNSAPEVHTQTYRELIQELGDTYALDETYPEAVVYAVRMMQNGVVEPGILSSLDDIVEYNAGEDIRNKTAAVFRNPNVN